MQLYQCNKANSELCPDINCPDKVPHELRIDRNKTTKCNTWAPCNTGEGDFIFKVRCVKVKE